MKLSNALIKTLVLAMASVTSAVSLTSSLCSPDVVTVTAYTEVNAPLPTIGTVDGGSDASADQLASTIQETSSSATSTTSNIASASTTETTPTTSSSTLTTVTTSTAETTPTASSTTSTTKTSPTTSSTTSTTKTTPTTSSSTSTTESTPTTKTTSTPKTSSTSSTTPTTKTTSTLKTSSTSSTTPTTKTTSTLKTSSTSSTTPTTKTTSTLKTSSTSSTTPTTKTTSTLKTSSTSSTSSTTPTTKTTAVASTSPVFNFESVYLEKQNYYRELHVDTPDLVWNDDIASIAQAYADSYTCNGVLTHSANTYNGNHLGENLAYGYDFTTAGAVTAWYNEIQYYDYSNPGYSSSTGHFTQLIWASSTDVGCGYKYCGTYYGYYVVCNYYPTGNLVLVGDPSYFFEVDVLPLK